MDFHNELYNKLYNPEKDELNDQKILELLRKLPEMYENGELVETEDICWEIAYAIRLFNCEEYKQAAVGVVDEIVKDIPENC